MTKFKVGDRVRRIGDECFVPVGTLGKVILESTIVDSVTVEWEWHGDISDYSPAQQCQWLELVPAEPLVVETCIKAYTAACEQFEAADLALEKAKAAVQDARLNLRDALDGET